MGQLLGQLAASLIFFWRLKSNNYWESSTFLTLLLSVSVLDRGRSERRQEHMTSILGAPTTPVYFHLAHRRQFFHCYLPLNTPGFLMVLG